jgi:hypothetical protein
MFRFFSPIILAGSLLFAPGLSTAQRLAPPVAVASEGIQVISGSFGTLGSARKLDIVAPLQSLCGHEAQSCRVFCSETSFGRYNLGRKPICRVTYRCGPSLVRSVEAAREEPLLIKCPDPVAEPPMVSPPPPTN